MRYDDDKKFFGFSGLDDLLAQFKPSRRDIQPKRAKDVLFACYEYEDYSGSALVVFEHDGKLYEVNGSHCSCNGLEECWSPEETSLEALRMRPLTRWTDAEATVAFCALILGKGYQTPKEHAKRAAKVNAPLRGRGIALGGVTT